MFFSMGERQLFSPSKVGPAEKYNATTRDNFRVGRELDLAPLRNHRSRSQGRNGHQLSGVNIVALRHLNNAGRIQRTIVLAAIFDAQT